MSTCAIHNECKAGEYEARSPTKQRDRICDTCVSGTYQPRAYQKTCLEATRCAPNEIEILKVTATSDRECLITPQCVNGQRVSTGASCACNDPLCARCSFQDRYTGALLIRKNETTRTRPIMVNGSVCFETFPEFTTTDEDYIYSCRDACLGDNGCTAFYVFSLTATPDVRGRCCLVEE